jgi:hypothetical protein
VNRNLGGEREGERGGFRYTPHFFNFYLLELELKRTRIHGAYSSTDDNRKQPTLKITKEISTAITKIAVLAPCFIFTQKRFFELLSNFYFCTSRRTAA